jgi:hypothetical protein
MPAHLAGITISGVTFFYPPEISEMTSFISVRSLPLALASIVSIDNQKSCRALAKHSI